MSCEGLRTWNIFTVCDGFISSRAIVVQSRDQMLLALWAQSLQIHTRHTVQNRRYHRAKVVTRSSRLKQICRLHSLCVHARMSYPSCVSQQMCIQEQLFQDGRVKAGGNAFPIKNPQCVGKKKSLWRGVLETFGVLHFSLPRPVSAVAVVRTFSHNHTMFATQTKQFGSLEWLTSLRSE